MFQKLHLITRYSWITAVFLLLAGFGLLHLGAVEYGSTFFVLFPLVVGFTIGTHPVKERVWITIGLIALLFFGFLLVGQLEGFICVLMALPIYLICLGLGYAVRKYFMKKAPPKARETMDHFLFSLVPLLLLVAGDRVESYFFAPPERITVTSSASLNFPAEDVFHEVKAMDTLAAPRPWGIRWGLPAPYRCVLEADTVGAYRRCLFRNGYILAQITKYQPGEVLEMDVIDYTLTGREWFRFQDATYSFARENDRTTITRTSSYSSTLRPRWYWEPIETWGIEQEHGFVLESLRLNLRQAAGLGEN